MNEQSLLGKIQSKYILKEIFNYIEMVNFKFKLFVHSNFFQKQLDLKLIDYQEAIINQLEMSLNDYLFLDFNTIEKEQFHNNIIKKN